MEQNQSQDQSPIKRPKGLFVHPNVHRRLKLFIVATGGSMQEATEEAVNEWLDRKEKEMQQ